MVKGYLFLLFLPRLESKICSICDERDMINELQ
jgi:hypothetical protein